MPTIHSDFHNNGVISALNRLECGLREDFPAEFRRIVGSVPKWVTDGNFHIVCATASVRDVIEYKRRFLRMANYLETREYTEDYSIPTFLIACNDRDPYEGIVVQDVVSKCRMAYGAMLESFARQKSLEFTPVKCTPPTTQAKTLFSRICSDAYFAALWTDSHCQYAFKIMESGVNEIQKNVHLNFGSPTIRLTASISSLPLISVGLENYKNGKTYKSTTKELLALLLRCTQSGSRGWEPALRHGMANDVVKNVCSSAFVACLIGMSPQLHPAARPNFEERFLSQNILESVIHGSTQDILCQCNVAVKESIRIYMCSILNDTPASRAAHCECGHSIGLLTSSPVQIANQALQAAAQSLVKAGVNASKAIGELRSSAVASVKVKTLIEEILKSIGMETRCRKRQAPSSARSLATTSSFHVDENEPVAISYVPSWVSRAQTLHQTPRQNVRAIDVSNEMLLRCFRMQFVPIWVHAHGNGIRASRLDPSQQGYVHETSPSHLITSGLDVETILRLHRAVSDDPLSRYKTIAAVAKLIGVDEQIVSGMCNCKSIEKAIELVSALSANDGARFITYCKISAMKEKLLCYDLGPSTKAKQLRALRLRFDLHDSKDVESDLPHHSKFLYWCLECGRVPNACVDASTRNIPHNEVGVSQTMMRVGYLGGCSDIRCARRSSAALRTAIQKEEDARRSRVDLIEVKESTMQKALEDNGDVSHAARLRRDVKSCAEQHSHALACGDERMIKIPLIGHCVRVHSNFYAICCYCASIMNIDQSMRFETEFCCGRCDPTMLGYKLPEGTDAAAAAEESIFSVVPDSKLHCRFCGKPPPTSGSATKFRIVRAPLDHCGRNSRLPPPLRTVAYCNTHYRPWIETAHQNLDVRVILAHISEKAVPVFGADVGKRNGEVLRLTNKGPAKTKSKTTVSIEKRMRANSRHTKGGR